MKATFLSICLLAGVSVAAAASAPASGSSAKVGGESGDRGGDALVSRPWSGGSAYTLPEGRVEVGLFQPLRWGLKSSFELSTHPLWALLVPNLALKKGWVSFSGWQLATRHSLSYPSGALRVVARDGTGGLLPARDTVAPHIIAMSHDVRICGAIGPGQLLKARLGWLLAVRMGRSRLWSIDLPVIYPRTAVYQEGVVTVAGIGWDGDLPGPFFASLDVDLFLIPSRHGPFALEQTAWVKWRPSTTFTLQAGAKLVFGAYPDSPGYRTAWDLLPMADLVWAFDP